MVSFEEITELYGVYIIFAIIGIFTILTVRFYSKKDIYDPEPKGRLFLAFILGIVSVIPALIFSLIGGLFVGFNTILLSVIIAPVMEEIAKLLFVIYLAKSDDFDGPLDGLIYGAMVGAGFAAAENVLYGFGQVNLSQGVTLTAFRSLTLIIGHPLYTGLAGVGVGEWKVGMARSKYDKIWRSMLFHGLWNLSASMSNIVLLFIGLVVVVVINVIVLRRELRRTLAIDKSAYERGYYTQKNQSNEQFNFQQNRDSNMSINNFDPNNDMIENGNLIKDNFCRDCGTSRFEGDRFCRNCGKPFQ